MRFYEATLEFQSEVAAQSAKSADPTIPLRQQIDLTAVSNTMPAILAVSMSRAPDALRADGQQLKEAGESRWRRLVEAAVASAQPLPVGSEDFFARACLQPFAENLQMQLATDPRDNKNVCPACGGQPQLAVLRPEGSGKSRSLLCSFCLFEWGFRNIICPICGEEDKDKRPNYRSEEWTYVYVEACDTCQHYLKAVDLTIDGAAVPLVDEAALAVLDVWASGLGYNKIIRNMIGF
jgi:formate dehydrogenase accessory protein FdhE